MIVNVFFALALLATAAAGYFAFTNKAAYEEEVNLTETSGVTLKAKNRERDSTAREKEEATASRDSAQKELSDANNEINAANSAIQKVKRDLSSKQGELKDIVEEIASRETAINGVQDTLQAMFPNEQVDIDNIQSQFEKLDSNIKDLIAREEELEVLVDQASKRLALDKNLFEQQSQRKEVYEQRLAVNSLSGLVTAVNSDWGFAVVNVGEDAGIQVDSELLVIRAGQRIGRLQPSRIESQQSIANIVRDTLNPGSMIRPGDRVILAKPSRGGL